MTFKFQHLVIQMDSNTQTKSLDSHKVFARNYKKHRNPSIHVKHEVSYIFVFASKTV